MRWRVLVAGGLLLAGCGGAPSTSGGSSPTPLATATPSALASVTPSAAPSSSPSPGASPSASPPAIGGVQARCLTPIPADRPLALVTLGSASSPILADVSDPAHPSTVCSITGQVFNPRLVSATEIAYVAQTASGSSLATLELATNSGGTVAGWTGQGFGSGMYAIAGNGVEIAYLNSTASGVEWHLVANENDRTVATLPPVPGRGASPDDDSVMLGFSSDGGYAALVQTFTGTGAGSTADGRFQVRRADGTLVESAGAGRTMAAWAGRGSTLYFRDAAGVERWSGPAHVTLVLPNVAWIRPSASSDGRWMAYTARDASGLPHAYLLDLVHGGAPRLIADGASAPVFLTPSVVWYQEERLCQASDACGMGGPSIPTGAAFLYDTVTGHAAASSISAVLGSVAPAR